MFYTLLLVYIYASCPDAVRAVGPPMNPTRPSPHTRRTRHYRLRLGIPPPLRLQPLEDAKLVEAIQPVSPNPYPGIGNRIAPTTTATTATSLELLRVLLLAARGYSNLYS